MELDSVPSAEESEVTLADLAAKMDTLGLQMNWLCENLQSLFQFVNAMGQNGGGIRGLMSALKQQPPQTMEDGNV